MDHIIVAFNSSAPRATVPEPVPPCPVCGRPRQVVKHRPQPRKTCGDKACVAALQAAGAKQGGIARGRDQLLLLMRQNGWTAPQARLYMEGWRAGARQAWARLQRRNRPAA
jgi:hypothetical protein